MTIMTTVLLKFMFTNSENKNKYLQEPHIILFILHFTNIYLKQKNILKSYERSENCLLKFVWN